MRIRVCGAGGLLVPEGSASRPVEVPSQSVRELLKKPKKAKTLAQNIFFAYLCNLQTQEKEALQSLQSIDAVVVLNQIKNHYGRAK